MHVSIIGSNGLLSACIASYCNEHSLELSVHGRTEPKFHNYTNYYNVDLVKDELNYIELAKSDVIIYTAGAGIQSILKEKPDLIYHLNVTVPVRICSYLKDAGYDKTFMSFGSYSEIGENANNRLFTEIDVLQSQYVAPNDYTVSKRMLSRFFSSFKASFTFLHFILPTIYGERESEHRLIPYTLKSIASNSDLTFTSGEQIRQYIYINDAVEILFAALKENLHSGIYNIAGAEEFSVRDLVTMLFKLKAKSMPDNIFGRTERADVGMKVLRLDGDKLLKAINYTPNNKISEIYTKYNF